MEVEPVAMTVGLYLGFWMVTLGQVTPSRTTVPPLLMSRVPVISTFFRVTVPRPTSSEIVRLFSTRIFW